MGKPKIKIKIEHVAINFINAHPEEFLGEEENYECEEGGEEMEDSIEELRDAGERIGGTINILAEALGLKSGEMCPHNIRLGQIRVILDVIKNDSDLRILTETVAKGDYTIAISALKENRLQSEEAKEVVKVWELQVKSAKI